MTFDNSGKIIIDSIFTNVLKEGLIFKSYRKCLNSKVFRFENGVTLLIVNNNPFLRCKI